MKVSGNLIAYNSKEFNQIFERLFPPMYMLASRILKSEEKGKDIAQEAFVKLWEKDVEEFASEKALQAYLYVLVKNACISQYRKEKNTFNTPLKNGIDIIQKSFLDEILRQETYMLLYDAIKDLSPQAVRVVELTLEGYRNEDIANELEVTINTVKTVKKRAYKKLKEKLGNQFVTILLTSLIQFF